MTAEKEQNRRVFDSWSGWWNRVQRANRGVYSAVLERVGPEHRRVLDVACGTGLLAILLTRALDGRTVHGIDLSPGMIGRAADLAATVGGERLHFSVADAEAIPYPDRSFDAVTNTLSFHHFPTPSLALFEIYRVLRPGGLFVLADVSPPRPLARLLTGLNYLYRRWAGVEWVRPPGEIVSLLEGAGFRVEESKPVPYFLPARVFLARKPVG